MQTASIHKTGRMGIPPWQVKTLGRWYYTSLPYIFNLNWQPSLDAENSASVSSVWANVAMPLSVGGGPLEGPKGLK